MILSVILGDVHCILLQNLFLSKMFQTPVKKVPSDLKPEGEEKKAVVQSVLLSLMRIKNTDIERH